MSELVSLLSRESGLSQRDLQKIILTAPARYKVFEIDKRNGGKREIAQPARELKMLQRILVSRILADLPVHEAALAYREGLSIRHNAFLHRGKTPILKMDFTDFFPSIRATDWHLYCQQKNILNDEDIYISSQIFFRRKKGEQLLRLSIGAPSSPMLSNVLMYAFDSAVSDAAKDKKVAYSRYADDLTFSGQRAGILKDFIRVVKTITKYLQLPSLKVNDEKTTFITTSNRRVVTGVVLTNDGHVSLGHQKKRLLSAQIHHASLHKLDPAEIQELCGQLAHANAIEPDFIERMRVKYGDANMRRIQQAGSWRSKLRSSEEN